MCLNSIVRRIQCRQTLGGEEKMAFSKPRMWMAVTTLVTSVVMTASAQTFKMTTPIAPGVATPNKLETSIGTLNLNDGYPDDATIAERSTTTWIASRALQAYLLAIPIVNQAGMRAIRSANSDQRTRQT
jgi:hypothetical protein